jgi:hypothetical protein
MAEKAVAERGVSIALACRAFGVSETCYRYSPKLDEENERIADLLVGLTQARRGWGFGLCFLHLRNVTRCVVAARLEPEAGRVSGGDARGKAGRNAVTMHVDAMPAGTFDGRFL